MSTIPQQLIEIAERAIKSGAKSGKECAEYTRKHSPDLAKNYISHLFLAFKMVKKASQFGPAIEQAKAGAKGTLAQLAKPYQGSVSGAVRANHALVTAPPRGAPVDDDLALALGLDGPKRKRQPEPAQRTRRRNDPPPNIAPSVYDHFYQMVQAGARKAKE